VNAHRVARFLGVRVWELPAVPEHYRAEAAVILTARHQAAVEKLNRLIESSKGVSPSLDMETLLGEF
jgi:hypothetical protein